MRVWALFPGYGQRCQRTVLGSGYNILGSRQTSALPRQSQALGHALATGARTPSQAGMSGMHS